MLGLVNVATITQIAFWSTTSIVATLTYKNAKKTIFQPIRTEVFKKQIDILSEVLRLFFDEENTTQLNGGLDDVEVLHVNAVKMYDTYGEFAFDYERPYELQEYRPEMCPMSIIDVNDLVKHFDYVTSDDTPESIATPEPIDEWDYDAFETSIPISYVLRKKQFENILENPLLPSVIADKIQLFLEGVDQNVSITRKVINIAAVEMPERYKDLDSLKSASTVWIRNRYNSERASVQPLAKEVIESVRDYFDSDNLIEHPRVSIRARLKIGKSGQVRTR